MMLKGALILFAICFVVACWVTVVGHQLDIAGFRSIDRLSIVDLILPTAYSVAMLSGCVAVAAFVMAVFKR